MREEDEVISFIMQEAYGTRYVQIRQFLKIPFINHAFFSRVGGVSTYPYYSLNFNKNGDSQDNIEKNKEIVSNILHCDSHNFVSIQQVQGDIILIIKEPLLDADVLSNKEGDALTTNVPNIVLSVKTGDCLPIIFSSTDGTVVGIAHTGWRGTLLRIANKVISVFENVFGCKREMILVGLGPSIGSCCYEVGWELYQKFQNDNFNIERCFYKKNKKLFLDLQMANIDEMTKFGIPRHHIFSIQLCTSCLRNDFFSYRRDKGITGRQINVITRQTK
ncbi:MAG: peptidoglycan editing factor PgeF [Thermodesulfobacteriota bacterium]|nr:peptidoglycan editing factor PgeF [Thermodesulfobacteriota bacterium]